MSVTRLELDPIVESHDRHFERVDEQTILLLEAEFPGIDLDADQNRSSAIASERRSEHPERKPSHRQRTVEGFAQRGRWLEGFGQNPRLDPFRGSGCVPRAGPDADAGPVDAHLDLAEAAVLLRVARVVAEQIVHAVVGDQALECAAEVIRADRGDAAGLLRQCSQAVLSRLDLVHERRRGEAEQRILWQGGDLDQVLPRGCETARIHGVYADVRTRRRADHLLEFKPERRCLCVRLRRQPAAGLGRTHLQLVIEPFTEQHDGLPLSGRSRQHVPQAGQRGQHASRLVGASGRERILDPLHPHVRPGRFVRVALRVHIELFEDCRPQLSARELVDGPEQEASVSREFLAGVGPAARVQHRCHVIWIEMPLNELPGRRFHEPRAKRRHVEIVEQQDVDATAVALVRPDVGLDSFGASRLRGRNTHDNGDLHEREAGDLLPPAVLVHLEVCETKIPNGDAPVDR